MDDALLKEDDAWSWSSPWSSSTKFIHSQLKFVALCVSNNIHKHVAHTRRNTCNKLETNTQNMPNAHERVYILCNSVFRMLCAALCFFVLLGARDLKPLASRSCIYVAFTFGVYSRNTKICVCAALPLCLNARAHWANYTVGTQCVCNTRALVGFADDALDLWERKRVWCTLVGTHLGSPAALGPQFVSGHIEQDVLKQRVP